MHWLYLTLAIILEVAGTTCMKYSDGFTHLVPSVLLFVFYALSFTAFAFALKQIDISLAYAMWAGLGVLLIAIIGITWFGEGANALKIVSIALIIAGVVGLNYSGAVH